MSEKYAIKTCTAVLLLCLFFTAIPAQAKLTQIVQASVPDHMDESLNSAAQEMLSAVTNQDEPVSGRPGLSITNQILGLAAVYPRKTVIFLPFENLSAHPGAVYADRLESYVANGLKRTGQFSVRFANKIKKLALQKNIVLPKSDNSNDVALFGHTMGANFVCVGSVLKIKKIEETSKGIFFDSKVEKASVAVDVRIIDTISGDAIYEFKGSKTISLESNNNKKKRWEKAVRKALYLLAQKVPNPFYVKTHNIEWVGSIISLNRGKKEVVIDAAEGLGMEGNGVIVEVYRGKEGQLDISSGHYIIPEKNKVGELEVVSFNKSTGEAVTKVHSGSGFKEGYLVRLKVKH